LQGRATLGPAFLVMKNVKLIIFDLDGTLIDAYPAIVSSFNYAMSKLGYPKQNALAIRRAVGWGDENLLMPFVKKGDLNKALIIYRKHHKKALLAGARLFPEVRVLLARLKKEGYKLAVATNRPTEFSLILIRHLKLSRYFDYILCADKLKHGKPHPEIINRIRRRFYLRPDEVIYVGDMVIDIQAGRRAKVKTIAVTGGSSTWVELKKKRPCRIIQNIRALSGILRRDKKQLTCH